MTDDDIVFFVFLLVCEIYNVLYTFYVLSRLLPIGIDLNTASVIYSI